LPAAITKPGAIQAATKAKSGPYSERAKRADLPRGRQARIVTQRRECDGREALTVDS
jgi:hypothetical protein